MTKHYIGITVDDPPKKSGYYLVIFDNGAENQLYFNKRRNKFIHFYKPKYWLKEVEVKQVSNKCQCKEDNGWTTVMACNICGYICDPAWVEMSQPHEPITDEPLEILKRLVDLKNHKDKYGKDLGYLRDQPILWEKAKAILKLINR